METWREAVQDTDERRVLEALADPRWDFRTLDGVAKDANLPRERVREIIQKHHDLVREAEVRSRGRKLFTLRERERSRYRELLDLTRLILSKSAK